MFWLQEDQAYSGWQVMTSKLTSFSFQPPFLFSHGIFNFHFQLAQAFGPKVLKVRARHDLESESNSQRVSGQYSPPSLFLTLVMRGKCLWMRGWVLENVPQQQRSKGWFITQEGDVQGKGDASNQLFNGHSEASGLPEWLLPNPDTMLPEWEISWSSYCFLVILCQNIIF